MIPTQPLAEEKRRLLEAAFDEHFDALLRWTCGLLHRHNIADHTRARTRADIALDILGSAYKSVLEQSNKFDATRDPLPWLRAYIVNCAKRERDRVFKANRSASDPTRVEVDATSLAIDDQSAEDALERCDASLRVSQGLLSARRPTLSETQQALASLLGVLSEADREIVSLSVFEGYDSPRLAERLGIAAPAARKRLQRALDRVRDHVARRPDEFSWIEDLPALLRGRARPESPGSEKSSASRHSRAPGPQLDHASPNAARRDAVAARSLDSTGAEAGTLSLSATPCGGEPTP